MNKYEILENIGEGEYGVVLKARNRETGELVAIKKFKEDDSDEQNKRVILREVKILKTISHDHVIELKEAFRKKGRIYLVCEYVDKNLLQVMEKHTITSSQLKSYVYQTLKGISYMHSLEIIHRDIKPENILILSRNDKVKICDLGFARTLPSAANPKMTDYVATRWYRPPELILGRDDYDKSIDIWALGCVMAEMIDGEPLFGGQNDLDQLYLIQKCLGPLTAQHQQYFLKNPKFVGMKFPDIHTLESIERRYFGKIDKAGIDLIKKMLKMEPSERITAEEALSHPFFSKNVTSSSEVELPRKSNISTNHSKEQSEGLVQLNMRANLAVNNFLQDNITSRPSKDDKVSTNKVTGLGKLKKFQKEHPQQHFLVGDSPNHYQDDFNGMASSGGATKGKSLGKKGAVNSIREKCKSNLKHTKSNFKEVRDATNNYPSKKLEKYESYEDAQEEQDYYDQSWEKEEPETKHESGSQEFSHQSQLQQSRVGKQFRDNRDKKSVFGVTQNSSLGGNHPNLAALGLEAQGWNLNGNIFQGVQGRSKSKQKMTSNRGYGNRQADSPTKEEYQKLKRNLKNMKKDNISIVFNNNTYNVNVMDQGLSGY